MNILYLLCIPLMMSSCNSADSGTENQKELYWATRFADAVIHEADSLIYFKREKPKYEYDYAFLASAIDKLRDVDPKYAAYARTYIDYFVKDDGHINGYKFSDFNIDRVRPGLNILGLYEDTGEEKYKLAAQTLASQMEAHPRTKSNGYWHKKVYPWQMWLDGIYMSHPFLTNYANVFNEPKRYDEVAFQILHIYEKTLDPETALLYHGWDESREQRWSNPETGQSKNFWSRAMGWYVMAVVDVLEVFPEDHPERENLISILNKTCEALMKVQDEKTGLWFQVLDKGSEEGNYIEGSGSAMFTYTFAKGAKLGFLPEKYKELANEAFDQMIEVLVREGDDGYPVLTSVCGAAGLGGNPYREADFAYYINEKKVDNDQKGIAPLIMAAIELGK